MPEFRWDHRSPIPALSEAWPSMPRGVPLLDSVLPEVLTRLSAQPGLWEVLQRLMTQ